MKKKVNEKDFEVLEMRTHLESSEKNTRAMHITLTNCLDQKESLQKRINVLESQPSADVVEAAIQAKYHNRCSQMETKLVRMTGKSKDLEFRLSQDEKNDLKNHKLIRDMELVCAKYEDISISQKESLHELQKENMRLENELHASGEPYRREIESMKHEIQKLKKENHTILNEIGGICTLREKIISLARVKHMNQLQRVKNQVRISSSFKGS